MNSVVFLLFLVTHLTKTVPLIGLSHGPLSFDNSSHIINIFEHVWDRVKISCAC